MLDDVRFQALPTRRDGSAKEWQKAQQAAAAAIKCNQAWAWCRSKRVAAQQLHCSSDMLEMSS